VSRGPIPIPTALKQAAGNPGRRELNDGEPSPPPGEITPPDWLTTEGREYWTRGAPIVKSMRTLTTADVNAFARYCNALARYVKLTKLIDAGGTTYTRLDEKGAIAYVGEIPQASEWRKLHEILLKLESHFGMTASARTRIRLEPVQAGAAAARENSDDARRQDFLARRGGASA
jgi:P27 family predicted phage terminase small subunit